MENKKELLEYLCSTIQERLRHNKGHIPEVNLHFLYVPDYSYMDAMIELKIDKRVIFKVNAKVSHPQNKTKVWDELSMMMIREVFIAGVMLSKKSLEDMDIVSWKG